MKAYYRLPAKWGGAMVQGSRDPEIPGFVIVGLDGVSTAFPQEIMERVSYSQPVAGFVYIPEDHNQQPLSDGTVNISAVFFRDASWPANTWWAHNRGDFTTWEDICQIGEPQQLHIETPGTAQCATCGQRKKTRVDGMIPQHGPGRGCPGSNKPPREEP